VCIGTAAVHAKEMLCRDDSRTQRMPLAWTIERPSDPGQNPMKDPAVCQAGGQDGASLMAYRISLEAMQRPGPQRRGEIRPQAKDHRRAWDMPSAASELTKPVQVGSSRSHTAHAWHLWAKGQTLDHVCPSSTNCPPQTAVVARSLPAATAKYADTAAGG